MKPNEYIPAIEKYVENIIVPKFPEFNNFIVHSESRTDGNEGGYVYVVFYTEGKRRTWFKHKLHHEIQQMRTYLSIPESVTIYYDAKKSSASL